MENKWEETENISQKKKNSMLKGKEIENIIGEIKKELIIKLKRDIGVIRKEIPKISGIYSIRNVINNKIYIGSAINLNKRLISNHLLSLNKKIHINKKLQNAWNKYGEESFTFEILEYCEKELLIEREQYYLDNLLFANDYKKFDIIGYNISPTAGNSLGVKRSDEFKKLISDKQKGRVSNRKGVKLENETKEKLRIVNSGKKLNDETKNKISIKLKGVNNWSSGENNPHYGKPRALETKRKISIGNSGAKNGMSKIILQFDLNNNLIKEWGCLKDVAIFFNVKGTSSLSKCLNGKIETYKNYKWKYK